SIYEILRNEKYTGIYIYNRTSGKINGKQNRRIQKDSKDIIKIKGGIPEVIDEKTFDRAQKILNENKRKGNNKAKKLYLLSGLIYCGECGGKMSGLRRHYYRKDGKVNNYYYICTNKKHKFTDCKMRSVRADKLEEQIVDLFSNIIYIENNIDVIVNSMKNKILADSHIDISKINKELKDTNNKINNLINALSQGITSETIVDEINNLEKKKDYLENQ